MASPAENSENEASNNARCSRPNSGRRLGIQCSEDDRDQHPPHDNVRVACQEAHYHYEVITLIEGYSRNVGPGKQHATGTSTLVKGPKNIVVDTGNPSEKDKLLCALLENGLTPGEIDVVVCTHGHSDHVGNLNLFPEAKFIVSYDVSEKDLYTVHDFQGGSPYIIDGYVQVIPTPGHTNTDVSVIVRETRYGVVAITGDLFEKAEDLEREDLWRQYSENIELQRKSREKIIQIADFIVPGHGGMFKNTRKVN